MIPNRRVLVIEDNRDTAESMRFLLEHQGYAVRVCRTGTEGLRSAQEWAVLAWAAPNGT